MADGEQAGRPGTRSGPAPALLSHIASYGLAFVPALVWLGGDLGVRVVAVTRRSHFRTSSRTTVGLVALYLRSVKRSRATPTDFIYFAVGQPFHVITLFLLALMVSA